MAQGAFLQLSWFMLALARLTSAGIACLSNPCLHGICIDDINSTYSCYCVDGYTGVQCQTNWDECWSNPCQNGGVCIDDVASYNCSCADGFIGDNCEINYNECESNPCSNNGTCIDLANGYICSCLPGFSGSHCEIDVAVCNNTEEVRCHNGGHCTEGPGFKYYCKCLPGWTGIRCEDAIDECKSNPCQHGGICIDAHADYMCACTFGFTGKSCETQIEFCDENSCSNNALCVVEDDVRVCYCVPDYHGEKCELQYDECLLGPRCMNGGTCIDGVDNFTCSCPPRLTGALCECLILDDGSLECNYVSPTPIPALTESTVYEDLSTGSSSTFFVTIGSDTPTNNETSLPTITPISTDTSRTTDADTSPETVSDTVVTDEMTAAVITESSSDITSTTESITSSKETIESGSSIAETTVECKGDCGQTTDFPTNFTSVLTTADVITESNESTTQEPEPSIVVTTPSADSEMPGTSTEKMFTDSPTEQTTFTSTDISTWSSISTTPSTETTLQGNSTLTSSTEIVQCSDSICHNHGVCISASHGLRCHCNFNYGGKFCDEKIIVTAAAFGGKSYLSHKLRNNTSIYIEFNARTLITDGQIMFVDIAQGIYMQLYMVSGLLKFKFSCGYQTMLLSELKTFVNKGYPMKIETRLDLDMVNQHCNATLQLNDTVAMSGGQVANISYFLQNTTLFLGNAPHLKNMDNKPFIGCIRDLIVNNEEREIFGEAFDAAEVSECSSLSCLSAPCNNGGSCQDHGQNYTCACSNGWTGDNCETSVCDNNPCQFGGTCVRHPGSGFLCLCPYGKHGIFCEYNVEITRPSFSPIAGGFSSYLKYNLPQAVNSERLDLRFRFQTPDMDQIALLAFIGQNGRHNSRSQHLAVTFVKGYLMLTWNMGNGARRIFTPRALASRRGGHWVRVGRRGRTAWLSVDGNFNVSGNAPGTDTKMTVLPYLYIGGHPSIDFNNLPHDLPLHSGWRGCMWEVSAGSGGVRVVSARGVGQCGVAHCSASTCNAPRGICIHHPATYGCICSEGWFGATCALSMNPCDRSHTSCTGRCVINAANHAYCDCPYGRTGTTCGTELYPTDVLFTGIRSYIRLKPQPISSISLSLEMDIKPGKARGLILFAETPHFYTALSLQGALLEYRWTERISGVSSVVGSSVVLSVGSWHAVRAGRYGSRLYVWVDGTLAANAMLAHAIPHTVDNATILLGGAQDLSTLPFDVMSGPPESYTGCIRNLNVNNILITLEKQNIEDGINLGDCDGTACGSEKCGNGNCFIENGIARCSCNNNGSPLSDNSGTRCRRHAYCTSSTCKQPRGSCKNGKCVCAAGYDGETCNQKINVTIPRFNGESLLLLDKTSNGYGHMGGQRLEKSQLMPNYLTLNFTTANPNGLLVWIAMDDDYIGIGEENGTLKLVYFFNKINNYKETLKGSQMNQTVSKLFPDIGILADAEWHVLVLNINNGNISLKLDGEFYYTQPLGVDELRKYDLMKIYLGGVLNEKKPREYFHANFRGCIGDIATDHNNFISNYTELYSENLKSCQLFPS